MINKPLSSIFVFRLRIKKIFIWFLKINQILIEDFYCIIWFILKSHTIVPIVPAAFIKHSKSVLLSKLTKY